MTIAVSIKVHDGVVLASDSATTLVNGQGDVLNVYNNANKIFSLYKGRPIGGMTWGAGSIGHASIATLAKDLRRRFMGFDAENLSWALGPGYTMEEVAHSARRFFYEELYVPAFQDAAVKPEFGFLVAGYSAGADLAEEWRFKTDASGVCPPPELVRPTEGVGISWAGQPEAISRLLNGFGPELSQVLVDLGVPAADVGPAIAQIRDRLGLQFAVAPMPIQDAIDLGGFLVHTTIQFCRFNPGPDTVGGPIEIAAITKHEGFRWVKRKHWYDVAYNRGDYEAEVRPLQAGADDDRSGRPADPSGTV